MTTTAPLQSGGVRSRRVARRVLAAVAVVTMLVLLPAVPSRWRSLTHIGVMSTSTAQGRSGYVQVQHCSRGWLLVDWTCTGYWGPADAEAQPLPRVNNVRLAGDPRHYDVGDGVNVELAAGAHDGYPWGGVAQLEVVLFWLAFLGAAYGAIALGRGWRRPGAAVAAVVVSALLTVLLHPLWKSDSFGSTSPNFRNVPSTSPGAPPHRH